MQSTPIVNPVYQLKKNSESDDQRLEIFNKHNNHDDLNSISVKRPQFPPNIEIEPLVANLLKHKTKNPKMPNEFFIYRAALVKELKLNNYKLKMTRLSALASDSWSREPSNVKSAYRKLARETERQYLSARTLELPNLAKSLNDNSEKSLQKKKIKNHSVSKPVTLNNKKEESVNNLVNTRLENDNNSAITALSNIDEMVNVTTVTQVTQPTLQYHSQVLAQPYEDDFTLMGDNSHHFVMRPRFDDQNEIYLIPPQEKNIMYTYNIDNSPISAYSSENSSPTSVYWSNPNSPSLQENNFFAPLQSPSIYEFNINYPQYYLQ